MSGGEKASPLSWPPAGLGRRRGPVAEIALRYVRFVPAIAVLGLAASLLEGLGIGLLIPLVSLLMARQGGLPDPVAAVFRYLDSLVPSAQVGFIAGAILTLIVIKALVQYANGLLIHWLDGRIGADLRAELAARLIRVDYPFFLQNARGDLVDIIAVHSWKVSSAIYSFLIAIPAILGLFVFGILLALIEWRLFLIVLIGAVLVRAILSRGHRRLGDLSFVQTRASQSLAGAMLEIVDGMRAIRVFGQYEREEQRFRERAEAVRAAEFAAMRQTAAILPMVEALATLVLVAVLLAAYQFATPVPVLTAFVAMISRALPHARVLSRNRIDVASVQGAMDRVEWLLTRQQEDSGTGRRKVEAIGGPIRFEDVSFSYPGSESASVHHLDFVLPAGGTTALLGHSGAGKSTVVNLLLGLIRPDSGRIAVGEDDLAAIDGNSWRGRIAVAGQDIALMEGTVASNIAYGNPGAGRGEIEHAARLAGIETMIARLPQGYDTTVGPGGMSLSVGQRQRIGIARALLTAPDLLILDEATSAVDGPTEQAILRALTCDRQFGSAVIVSHRKSTLSACDQGFVLDHGRIVESGPIARLSYYRSMGEEDSGREL